jgi:hypothetical protein
MGEASNDFPIATVGDSHKGPLITGEITPSLKIIKVNE